MVVEERIDALFSEIGWAIIATPRANGRIGELKPTLVSIAPVSALQIANNEASARSVVGVVAEGLHGEDAPALVTLVRNPAVVRSKLGEIANEGLYHVLRAANGVHVTPCHQDFFADLAESIPVLSIFDSPVSNPEVVTEEFVLQDAKFLLE